MLAMKTKPPVALPLTAVPKAESNAGSFATPAPTPREITSEITSETMNSIAVRATSVTVVLQKIMLHGSGYRHGGLNE